MDIVQEMLKKGVLLSPEAAAALREKPELAATFHSTGSIVVQTEKPKPTILWQSPDTSTTSIATLAEAYTARHAFFRTLLEPKADRALLTSVSKINQGSRISVIGLVLEVRDDSVLLEDNTGRIRVFTSEKLIEDECVLVTGMATPDGLRADIVIFPDIPIGRPVKTTAEETVCVFTSRPTQTEDKIVVITDPKTEKTTVTKLGRNNVVVWPDSGPDAPKTPCALNIDGLIILIERTTKDQLIETTGLQEPEKAAARLLKARHLDPRRYLKGDPLLLREVPDVVCLITEIQFTTNYKGVTVISPGEGACVVNLKTREVQNS